MASSTHSLVERAFDAIKRKRVDALAQALDAGLDPNARDCEGNTPLCWAAQRSRADCVSLLIERGAALNETGRLRRSAAVEAAISGDLQCLRVLIEAGADPFLRDVNERDALACAFSNIPALALMAELGVDLAHPDTAGRSVLMSAAAWGSAEGCSFLLNHGLDPNAASFQGGTALMTAASHGRVDTIALLASHGADLDARDRDGWSAAAYACAIGRLESLRLLAELGASLDPFEDVDCAELASDHDERDCAEFARAWRGARAASRELEEEVPTAGSKPAPRM